MSGALFYFGIVFCFLTVAVLLIGLLGFGTGLTSSRTSNKLMTFRILFQFIAVVLIVAAAALVSGGN
ncbi:MAG: twin transmembrane helix small protein [Pseudomonadota bacterium]